MFKPEQTLIMAGLLANFFSERLPIVSTGALAKVDPSALSSWKLTVAGLF